MIKFNSAFPLYVTDKLEAQKAFYTEMFGFEPVFYDSEFYLHLINPSNGVELGFMLPNLENMQPSFLHTGAQADGMVITFEVDNASEAYEQAKKLKLPIVFELKTEPWNQIHFMVRDPAGFVIDIVEDSNQSH